MGQFSWCTSDTKKSIPCCLPFGDLPGTVYLLNPFGEPYKESDYEGYGVFGGHDVYELVAEWNREYLSPESLTKPERSHYGPGEEGDAHFARSLEKYNEACAALEAYASGASDEFMLEHYGKVLGYGDGTDWKRCLGISIACFDEDHVKLKYPIKIVEHPMPYEQAGISPGCPFQGCFYPDRISDIREKVMEAFDQLAIEEEKAKARGQSLADKLQSACTRAETAAPESQSIAADSYAFSFTKEELEMVKSALDVMGDRMADREGYSSGEPFWDLKEKLEGLDLSAKDLPTKQNEPTL